ncbi:MAG: DUF2207 domain-containing protein [Bacilli bacterium]|nr:DUF2207 domain-containing protein [Bacilli bacterium]MDD4808626.1 DUF2207 domain-containing protein [Bacilli bacterium]
MKKILFFLTLLCLPFSISAKSEITNNYIDYTILKNGDVVVKELLVIDANYDTFSYFLSYPNKSNKQFNGSIDSYMNSDLYNYDDVILKTIKVVEVDEQLNFNDINKEGYCIDLVDSSEVSKGDSNKYVINKMKDGLEVTIYYPSKDKTGFYIEYLISNLAVLHNDTGELKLDIFKEGHPIIKNLEIRINIPNHVGTLKSWVHSSHRGNIVIMDNEEVIIPVKNFNKKDTISVRLLFEPEVISESKKLSHVDSIIQINEVESRLVEAEEEQIRIENLKLQIGKLVLEVLGTIWLLGIIYFFLRVYFKHDREHQGKYKDKYYQNIPDNYSPAIVGYLMSKTIGDNDLAATVCNLIDRKVIEVKQVDDEDYLLSWKKTDDIKETDRKVIDMIFGVEQDVTLTNLKTNAITNKDKFLHKYDNWFVHSMIEIEAQKLYESTPKVKLKMVLYSLIGLLIILLSYFFPIEPFIFKVILITSLIGIGYFATFRKKTVKGANKYSKWKAFRNHLKDFDKIENKDLPDINSWDKFLIYAITFGFNDELYETMKDKLNSSQTKKNKKVLDTLNLYQEVTKEIRSAIKAAHSN